MMTKLTKKDLKEIKRKNKYDEKIGLGVNKERHEVLRKMVEEMGIGKNH